MKSIIIIGYMGAGKTTVGKALAKELGIMFYDLDWYIESRMHKTVKQIFDESGEDGFRQIEHNMLHEVAEFENIVLSCGGGTPCFFDNMDYMNQLGETVYLKASPETLYAHLRACVHCCSTRRLKRFKSSSVSNSRNESHSMRRQSIYSMST